MSSNSLRLYLHYASISFRSQMEYRASFVIRTVAHFAITGVEFLGLVVLFQRFGRIETWTLPQVGFLYGIVSVAFAIAEAVPRGFDIFPSLIKSGDFDRVLVRPRSPALQVLGQEFQLMRAGRFLQGAAVLAWSGWHLGVEWSIAKALLLISAIAGGACLFSGLFVLQAAMCFWTVESIEIINCATYGGVETAQFPLTIYRSWFRNIFTFVIPLATINYFPAHVIFPISRGSDLPSAIYWMSPLAGVVFLALCLQVWRFGIRRYTSTGS